MEEVKNNYSNHNYVYKLVSNTDRKKTEKWIDYHYNLDFL